MDGGKIVTLQVSLTMRTICVLLAGFFIAWHPGSIGSETLTMTAYYPAPYGGYASLLSVGDTVLARDGGTVSVRIDPNPSSPRLAVMGNSRGVLHFAVPSGSNGAITGEYTLAPAALNGLTYQAGEGGAVIYNSSIGSEAALMLIGNRFSGKKQVKMKDNLHVENDMRIEGRIRNSCYTKHYGSPDGSVPTTSCNAPEDMVFMWYGDGLLVKRGAIPGVIGWSNYEMVEGNDWSGQMLCCRITGPRL